MKMKRTQPETKQLKAVDPLPRSVTKEAIAETLAVWQPYSKEKLTESDAIEMLVNVRRLAGVLRRTCQPQPKVEQLPQLARTYAA